MGDSESKVAIDILNSINKIKNSGKTPEEINSLLNDAGIELVGLYTENASQKDKLVESNTRRVITEFMIQHLNEIEREIINNTKIKTKIYQKINSLITHYISTNYFRKIYVVTMVDDFIESIFGDEYTLSKYIFDRYSKYLRDDNYDELVKYSAIYGHVIDNADVHDLKIGYRKAIVEGNSASDIITDIWTKLLAIMGKDLCEKIYNNLSTFNFNKLNHNKKFLKPVIEKILLKKDMINEEFCRVKQAGVEYYGAPIFTLGAANISDFDSYLEKIRTAGYVDEANILSAYMVNNILLLTDDVIEMKFRSLNEELYNELINLNSRKYRSICLGFIILTDPTENIFDSDGTLNFIVRNLLKSIFKMSEVVLIGDFEFQEFQKEILITLQQISRLRDIETSAHQERVTIYTKVLAEALLNKKESGELNKLILTNGLSEATDYHIVDKEYVRDLIYSASLHDLGKVGISDDVLKKPDKLTKDEYVYMQSHTDLGFQKLSSVTRMSKNKTFLVLAAALAGNHHEKWNGHGYPYGKKEFEIPLSARILAIADVYDALRIRRPYKKPFDHYQAINIILHEKSRHFDPVLVDIFYEYNKKFDESFQSVQENKII